MPSVATAEASSESRSIESVPRDGVVGHTALTAHAEGAQTPGQAAEVVARWVAAEDDVPSGTFQGPDGVWPLVSAVSGTRGGPAGQPFTEPEARPET